VEFMTDSDICAFCGGKLREGFTELVLKAGDELAVTKRVPALVCNCCYEAYLTPEVPKRIDKVMREYRAGKLLASPLAAGEIELMMSVSITSFWSNCHSYRIL
jgi:YgiT-type zinc finger domain-containing protein